MTDVAQSVRGHILDVVGRSTAHVAGGGSSPRVPIGVLAFLLLLFPGCGESDTSSGHGNSGSGPTPAVTASTTAETDSSASEAGSSTPEPGTIEFEYMRAPESPVHLPERSTTAIRSLAVKAETFVAVTKQPRMALV
jgi:hypothetical protein